MIILVIVIYGGVGIIMCVLFLVEDEVCYYQVFFDIVVVGQVVFNVGGLVLEVVIEVVCLLEDCLFFNVGYGVVYISEGKYELDVCVMNGVDFVFGVVVCVIKLCNFILVVCMVMEKSEYVLLVGFVVEVFVVCYGVVMVEFDYFYIDVCYE